MEYPDSVSSSPRSIGAARSVDQDFGADNRRLDEGKVRFMCSFGGKIMPRPHDNQLCYVGGDSRMVAVQRHTTYADLISKLSKMFGTLVSLKYQLPNEDLDALISVTSDEDLENMLEEYDRLQQEQQQENQVSSKNSRLRVFLFPAKNDNSSSLGSYVDTGKKEGWFVEALNGGNQPLSRGISEGSSFCEMPDYLSAYDNSEPWDDKSSNATNKQTAIASSGLQQGPQTQPPRPKSTNPPSDIHSAPDSPMLETGSFGSTSSAHLVSNLPPVKVKPSVEDSNDGRPPFVGKAGMEGPDLRYLNDDSGRGGAYRGNTTANEGYAQEGDSYFHVTQDMGLRTQDPRLNFEDHIAKFKNLQYVDQREAKISGSSPRDAALRLVNPEQIPPVNEFEHLQISNKPYQQERQMRQDYAEENVDGRYDWGAKQILNSKPSDIEGYNQPGLKKDDSSTSLPAVMIGMKRDGSQDRDPRMRQLQEETNLKHAHSNPSLDKRTEELDSGNYGHKDSPVMHQQSSQEHSYMPAQYEQPQFVQHHYVQQGQPPPYYQAHQNHHQAQMQAHHDQQHQAQAQAQAQAHQAQVQAHYDHQQQQQGDPNYPVYMVPSHHHSAPNMQQMNPVMRPVHGQPGYGMPVPRSMTVVSHNHLPGVYSSDGMHPKPVTVPIQHPTAPPMQRQPVYDTMPKHVMMPAATQLKEHQVPVLPNVVAGVPRYRAPQPRPADVRVMYRPGPVPTSVYPDQQYAVHHMQAPQSMGFENPPQQQMYYTQSASVPSHPHHPYQGVGAPDADRHSTS